MPLGDAEVVNMALSHIGIGSEVSSVETEASQEAQAARRFLGPAREEILRSFPWPFATKFAVLGLVATAPTEIDEEWGFSYRYPSDCVKLRRIRSGSRNDTHETRVPYKIGQDTDGLLIYTDFQTAEIEYTKRETNMARWPYDATLALSYRLAAYFAPRLTDGDPRQMRILVAQLYRLSLQVAQANALGEEQHDTVPKSDLENAR